MEKKKLLYALAGLGGVAAWLLFILACSGWPAWSPDGGKVLFPYAEPDSREAGIALHDRAAGSVTSLFHFQAADSGNGMIPFAQFTRDGKRAVVVMEWDRGRSAEALVLPVGGSAPAEHFLLPESNEISLPPYPEVGGNLFLGFNYIARLNLRTGAVETKKLSEGKGIHLIPGGDRIWFMVYDIDRPGREGSGMQFGELNPTDLSLKPFFDFWEPDQQKHGITDLNVYALTSEPGGEKLLASARAEDKSVLVVFGKAGVERIIQPVFPVEGCQMFGVAWSADRKTVYAATVVPGKEKDRQDLALAEIPLSGGTVKLNVVAHLIRLKDPDNLPGIYLHVSLSPDGHTLATSTGYIPGQHLVSRDDRGLFLVDLTDPARKVSRIAVPAPAGRE
ncbi:MAG: hypothetical protein LAP21_24155 [Acidobacteriia bacterium]|nr:hypothetical protein [Terriglobia bacterium]